MRRRVVPAISVALAAIALGLYYRSTMPPDPWNFLETAPQWMVYSLDPRTGHPLEPGTPRLLSWKALGRTTVGQNQTPPLLAALRKGIDNAPNDPPACFNPRLGIHAERDGHHVDFIICFQCVSYTIYYDDRMVRGGLISEAPEPAFDKIFQDANLPKAPKE